MSIFDKMAQNWPSPIVARREVGRFTGGLVQPKTLANCDSLGVGPEERVEIGGKIGYPVDSLILWLKQRSKQP